MSGWKLIFSAPKEEPVLIWESGKVSIAEQAYETPDWESGQKGFWFWDNNTGDDLFPTHWMPLPEAPPNSGEVKS